MFSISQSETICANCLIQKSKVSILKQSGSRYVCFLESDVDLTRSSLRQEIRNSTSTRNQEIKQFCCFQDQDVMELFPPLLDSRPRSASKIASLNRRPPPIAIHAFGASRQLRSFLFCSRLSAVYRNRCSGSFCAGVISLRL